MELDGLTNAASVPSGLGPDGRLGHSRYQARRHLNTIQAYYIHIHTFRAFSPILGFSIGVLIKCFKLDILSTLVELVSKD